MRTISKPLSAGQGQTSLRPSDGLVTFREANQTLGNELVARRKTNRVRRGLQNLSPARLSGRRTSDFI
jgi:hypothetical protein